MQIYAAILEMLKQQENGVLVTVIGCSPSCRPLLGKHFLYKVDSLEEWQEPSFKGTSEEAQESSGNNVQVSFKSLRESVKSPRESFKSPRESFKSLQEGVHGSTQGSVLFDGDIHLQIAEEYTDRLMEEITVLCQTTLEKRELGRARVELLSSEYRQAEHARVGQPIAELAPAQLEWLDVMLEPIAPAPRLLIFGCGHVGQALAWLAHLSDFPVTVVDDRPVFASGDFFPAGTEVICDDFTRAIEQLNPGANDFLVIVTRGHQYDRLCLSRLVGRQMAYIGMIGSKRRVAALFQEMVKEGADPAWLERVHSPIGIDIGAETPAEIAVSIMAELIRVRRKGA